MHVYLQGWLLSVNSILGNEFSYLQGLLITWYISLYLCNLMLVCFYSINDRELMRSCVHISFLIWHLFILSHVVKSVYIYCININLARRCWYCCILIVNSWWWMIFDRKRRKSLPTSFRRLGKRVPENELQQLVFNQKRQNSLALAPAFS